MSAAYALSSLCSDASVSSMIDCLSWIVFFSFIIFSIFSWSVSSLCCFVRMFFSRRIVLLIDFSSFFRCLWRLGVLMHLSAAISWASLLRACSLSLSFRVARARWQR